MSGYREQIEDVANRIEQHASVALNDLRMDMNFNSVQNRLHGILFAARELVALSKCSECNGSGIRPDSQ